MRKTITIADLGTIITGKTPPTTNKNYYGDYAVFIKPTDISEQCKFTYETEEMYSKLAAKKYESSLIPKGAICVPCIGTIGTKMTMAPCDCYTNQSINSIVCNEYYDNEYVYYLIKNFLPGLKAYNLGTASGREYVSKSNFEKIELVAEQDKNIQKRIGLILSRYDSLIENYQRQIKLLEEAAQRLYKEWFVDLHFPGHENTKIVDGVPEGWEKKKIEDVCDTIGGGTPSTKIASYYDGGTISWVTPTDITRNNSLCLLGTEKKITQEGLCHSSAKMLPPGTILMTSRASVGYFGICDFEVCTNQGFISCVPFENNFQMYLLYNLMNRVEEIRIKAGGSTYLEISKSVFRNFDIMCPSKSVIDKFQQEVHRILDKTKNIAKQIRLLTEARDRLLPKLMSGEINSL